MEIAEPAAGVVAATHTYVDGGAYPLVVCVSDDDGGTTCDTITLAAAKRPARCRR